MFRRMTITTRVGAIASIVLLALIVSGVSISKAIDWTPGQAQSGAQPQELQVAADQIQSQEPEAQADEAGAQPQEPEVVAEKPKSQEAEVPAEEAQPQEPRVTVEETETQEQKVAAEEVELQQPEPQDPEPSGALETLAEFRAEESATFQAYNNALYEQESPDEVEARKERFERVQAEKQAYLDSLSSELRADIEDEQERRVEEAQAAAPEIREQFASADPAPAPPELLQESEAEVAKTPEPQLEPQAVEVEEVPEPQPDLQTQEEEQAASELAEAQAAEQAAALQLQQQEEERAAAELAKQQAAQQQADLQAQRQEEDQQAALEQQESAPVEEDTPPPPEVAGAVVDRAASFVGTPAVEENAAPEQQQEPTPTGATDAQYQEEEAVPGQQLEPAPGEESSTPVTGAAGNQIVAEGANYYGTPYELGGPAQCVPYETMDCSCLTMTVFAEFGIFLPDDPQAQMGYGTPVSGAPQAGDLVFWSEDGSGIVTHVGIATGNGTTIHASAYAGYVTETPIEYIPGYIGARRLL